MVRTTAPQTPTLAQALTCATATPAMFGTTAVALAIAAPPPTRAVGPVQGETSAGPRGMCAPPSTSATGAIPAMGCRMCARPRICARGRVTIVRMPRRTTAAPIPARRRTNAARATTASPIRATTSILATGVQTTAVTPTLVGRTIVRPTSLTPTTIAGVRTIVM